MSEIPKIARARLGGLAGQAAGAGSHPDADQLTAFLEHTLGQREREQVLEHLARCAECREIVAVALPPEEAARAAEPARAGSPAPLMRWFEWSARGGRWAAVAATFVIAVTLMFRAYRESPQDFSQTAARRAPEVAAPAEKAKQPAKADEAQAREELPSTSPAAPAAAPPTSSTVAASRDLEAGAGRGPSKLADVGRAKTAPVPGVAGGVPGGRRDDSKKLGAATKVEAGGAAGGKVAAAAPAPMVTTSEVKRGPAAQQQQVGALAQQAPAAVPPAGEEAKGEVTAEGESRAAADELSAQAAARNQAVVLEKDSDQRARKEAPARELAKFEEPEMRPGMHWIITAQGRVQRTADGGKTWKEVALDSRIRFRAVSARGAEVWAGGEAGALYHSADSGQHWARVPLPAELASATIVRVEFTDARQGTLATASGETWTTSDAGATWHKP